MTTDFLYFVGLMVVILLTYMTWKLRGKNWKEYFSTKEGNGILASMFRGIGGVILLALLVWLFMGAVQAAPGTWVNDAGVFAGIDYTNKVSPACKQNTVDDRGTSNLGAWVNIWQSESKRVRVNSKYTHHSCVLGADDKQYDAIGVELQWKIWER